MLLSTALPCIIVSFNLFIEMGLSVYAVQSFRTFGDLVGGDKL